MTDELNFDKIRENTLGDITFVKTKKKTALYASVVDHDTNTIITRTIFEVKDERDLKDICKDLDINHFDDGDEEINNLGKFKK